MVGPLRFSFWSNVPGRGLGGNLPKRSLSRAGAKPIQCASTIALATPERASFGDIPWKEGSFEDWIFLIQGTKQLRDALGEDIFESPLAPILKFGADRWNLQRPSAVAGIWGSDMLCELQDRIYASVKGAVKLQIYDETINSLRSAACYSINWEGIDAFIWIYRCIDGFLPLLQLVTQEALVILAHFCVMIKKSETQWWMQGWTNRIMSEVYGRMDEEHKAKSRTGRTQHGPLKPVNGSVHI